MISPPDELAASSLKRALKVQPAAGLKNEAEKERSRAAKQLDTHMKVRRLLLDVLHYLVCCCRAAGSSAVHCDRLSGDSLCGDKLGGASRCSCANRGG